MNFTPSVHSRSFWAAFGLLLALAGPARAVEAPAAVTWPLGVPFCGSGDGRAFAPTLDGFGSCPSNGPCDLAELRDASWAGPASPYKLVRLRIHAVSASNGSNPSATPAEIERMIRVLNDGFRPARIQFIASYRTVSNSTYRNVGTDLIGGVTSSDRMKDALAQNPESQLNLFITGYTPGNCGIARFPWESVVLAPRGGFIMADYSVAPTRFGVHTNILKCVVHEAGHAFGLLHTFAGVTEVGGCATGCREVVGRSVTDGNCKGDFCADTVPEPDVGILTGACTAPGTNDSCNGLPYSVLNPGNFMNYYVSCYSQFTPQQIARMHCWVDAVLGAWLIHDATPPSVAITAPLNGASLTSLSTVAGTASDDVLLDSVSVTIQEQDGFFNRWWNGTNWQATAFPLPVVLAGSNWVLAPSVARPPLNSGIHYLISASAVDAQFNAASAVATIQRPAETLVWDPGTSHAGTQVKSQPHVLGGYHVYRIVASNTTFGAWRSALTVTNGEANLRLALGVSPLEGGFTYVSSQTGSDGWVLSGRDFSPGEEWFYAVESFPGARWNLVSGEPFVMNLGALPGPAAPADTTAVVGAEGWRFFRTVPNAGTLAWRLWLHGATNPVMVARDRVPVISPSGNEQLDQRRPRAMLVVPPYLEPATTHFVGVPGRPGASLTLLSSEQPVVDQPFASTRNGVVVGGFPYTTYRIPVPIDQIAWELRSQPLSGDPQVAVRRGMVPNEDDNDGFSEVASPVADALTLVPPVLSDGVFFATVYADGPHSFNFRNGEPIITVRPFSSVTTNDLPAQSGTRYYVVNDIPAQIGTLGWELVLSNQAPDSRLAVRRNAVPGRWLYRTSGGTFQQSYGDDVSDTGFLQRPGHQADVWYVGVSQVVTNLGAFVLDTHPLVPQVLALNNGQVTVTGGSPGRWSYFRVDVPPGLLGWELRLRNTVNDGLQFAVRRDLLPASLGGVVYGATWPSRAQFGAGYDWTYLAFDSSGISQVGKALVVGTDNPLEPGTYYIGAMDPLGPGPVDFELVSRGIGTGLAIGVSNLVFNGGTAAPAAGLPPRESAHYRVIIPSNQPSWRVRLTPLAGDASLVMQRDVIPNSTAAAAGNDLVVSGKVLSKVGREHYVLLPREGEAVLPAGTNYLVVTSQGDPADAFSGRTGAGAVPYSLESLGPVAPSVLGTIPAPGLGSLNAAVSVEGGELRMYRFVVPANTAALEIRVSALAGNPAVALRPGTEPPYPHVPAAFQPVYGSDGGWLAGRHELNAGLLSVPNPAPGVWTMTALAETEAGTYPDAEFTIDVRATAPAALAFDTGSAPVPGQESGSWRYFQVTVPPGALGWNLRVTNRVGGTPRLVVRRDLLPEGIYSSGVDCCSWPSGGQVSVVGDATGRPLDPDGADATGEVLTTSRGLPLEPGSYYVGVYNSGPDPVDYRLTSRGVGAGFRLGITNLAFSGAGSRVTNHAGLPPRETAYYRVIIPSNTPSWQVHVTPEDDGELLLLVHPASVPNSIGNPGGRRMSRVGPEHYALLPADGQSWLEPGTNYLAVVSEGTSPAPGAVGAAPVRYRIESLGRLPVTSLGTVPPVGSPGVSTAINLAGGTLGLFRFQVPGAPSTPPAVEIRLRNRTGNPVLAWSAGTNPPIPYVPAVVGGYGVDGGQYWERREDPELITLANPAPGFHTVTVLAHTGEGGDPDAAADLEVIAVGPEALPFDGPGIAVDAHEPLSWRYFTVVVPADAAGWDLRVNGPVSGEPRLWIRRGGLPVGVSTMSAHGSEWPDGGELPALGEFTGLNDPDGRWFGGRASVAGTGDPLSPGTYYVGVYNADPAVQANYVIESRGIGNGHAIPLTSLAFAGGSQSVADLPARDFALFRVDVPPGVAGWRLRLAADLGEVMMVVRDGVVPNGSAGGSTKYWGKILRKAGPEQFVLLPEPGATTLPGGPLVIAVAAEGTDSGSGRAMGTSSFTLTSLGPVIVGGLGPVPAPGGALTTPVNLEGGASVFHSFVVPGSVGWIEASLGEVVGQPALAVVPGVAPPVPHVPAVPGNEYGAEGGSVAGRLESPARVTIPRPSPGVITLSVKAETVLGGYPDAAATLRIEQKTPGTLAFSNGLAAGSLVDDQRMFYAVTVPAGVPGWKLDLSAANGRPMLRVRRGLLPSDAEPAMPFGGPSVVIVPPFLEPGTWYVEVKGVGATDYSLRSHPLELVRPAWNMPVDGAPVTTPGLPAAGSGFGDSGVDTNGVALPGDQGIDLANGDFHYYAVTVPAGNVGLLRTELTAISGDPDLYLRAGGAPTLSHPVFGTGGSELIDYRLTGPGSQYGNWVPLDGRVDHELAPGPWYVAVHAAGNANVRYRLRLSTGLVTTNLVAGLSLSNQVVAAGDWRYVRILVPSNAPTSLEVTFHQQQGDVALHVRDTVPPGDPAVFGYFRDWMTDNKNDGPYATYDEPGTRIFTTPPLRPGQKYYLGFRPQGEDATYSVSYRFSPGLTDATNIVPFAGGLRTVLLPPAGVARFRVPVPAGATSWRHYCTNSEDVFVWLEQGTLPDAGRAPDWSSAGLPNPSLVTPLTGWPWVPDQAYFLTASNANASARTFTLRLDGRTAATDDVDADGLPDAWELVYFGNLDQDGVGDPDDDGVSNADELAEGTDPSDPASLRPRVTVHVTGSGTVVREPSLPSYAAGQPVTLTAVGDPGWIFAGWSGTVTTHRNPLMLTLVSNVTLTATFTPVGGGPVILSEPQMTVDGRFQFAADGPPGVLVIEASADLVNWFDLITVDPFTGHEVLEIDPVIPVRFFRGRWQP